MTNMATTDSVGSFAAANLQRHGSACHQRHGLSLSGLQPSYIRPLFRAFVNYPTESVHVECLMRTLMIKRFTEVGELLLLGAKIGPRRSGGVGVQGAMQARVAAVLLRCARCDALRQEAQADPPGGQLGQPGEGVGGKGHAVVGAEALRPAECFAHAHEDRLGLPHTGGGEGFAPKQEATVAIGDGQRRSGAAVPGLEVPCEVGTPHLVGGSHVAGRLARMPNDAALAPLGHQIVAAEDVTDRRAGWPGPAGIAWAEDRHSLLRPPGRMPAPGVEDRRHQVVRRVAGRRAWPTRARFEALRAVREIAVDPCVRSLTADPVERAELGDGEAITPIISDEVGFLVHGRCVPPGHGAPPWCPLSSCCYPCLWTQRLPMCPDYTWETANQGMQPTRQKLRAAVAPAGRR
jgi:hypothetical protein